MTGWLLDTNVLSELRRPRPEPKVVAFVRDQPLDSLHISTVTLAEIRFGIERLRASSRKVVSGFRKKHDAAQEARASSWIRYPGRCSSEGEQRTALRQWLDSRIRPMFERRTLAITEDVMLRWWLLIDEGKKARHTFTQPDLIIAATAFTHDLTVVTRDVNDYRRAQVAVMNPWLAPHSS